MEVYNTNNELDIKKFNKIFEQNQLENINEEIDEEIINKDNDKLLHNMTYETIFNNMNDEVFGIIFDLISLNYKKTITEIFTKNDRLLYLGLFLIIVCIILYIISFLFFSDMPLKTISKNKKNMPNYQYNSMIENQKFQYLNNEIFQIKQLIANNNLSQNNNFKPQQIQENNNFKPQQIQENNNLNKQNNVIKHEHTVKKESNFFGMISLIGSKLSQVPLHIWGVIAVSIFGLGSGIIIYLNTMFENAKQKIAKQKRKGKLNLEEEIKKD